MPIRLPTQSFPLPGALPHAQRAGGDSPFVGTRNGITDVIAHEVDAVTARVKQSVEEGVRSGLRPLVIANAVTLGVTVLLAFAKALDRRGQ